MKLGKYLVLETSGLARVRFKKLTLVRAKSVSGEELKRTRGKSFESADGCWDLFSEQRSSGSG